MARGLSTGKKVARAARISGKKGTRLTGAPQPGKAVLPGKRAPQSGAHAASAGTGAKVGKGK